MTKKNISIAGFILTILVSLSGCSQIGSKSANVSAIYIVTTVLSFLLLLGYLAFIKKKELWFIILFSSVVVVNIGYLCLSFSGTLNEALLSNRIAYLGSVLLPVSMLMTILNICKIKLKKWIISIILSISLGVFLIAASPGYLNIYYEEVSLVVINGVSVLEKVYGPLHSVYLYYLVLHFSAMIGAIIFAKVTSRIKSTIHALAILSSVIVNIGVWLMEQLIKFDFEFLSISYIVTEIFLLGISLIIQDSTLRNSLLSATNSNHTAINTSQDKKENSELFAAQCEYLQSNLHTLTPTEKTVYLLYLDGKGTKDVMAELNISENTVKYHNKNIYSKLGVKSRKQLLQIAKTLISD